MSKRISFPKLKTGVRRCPDKWFFSPRTRYGAYTRIIVSQFSVALAGFYRRLNLASGLGKINGIFIETDASASSVRGIAARDSFPN